MKDARVGEVRVTPPLLRTAMYKIMHREDNTNLLRMILKRATLPKTKRSVPTPSSKTFYPKRKKRKSVASPANNLSVKKPTLTPATILSIHGMVNRMRGDKCLALRGHFLAPFVLVC